MQPVGSEKVDLIVKRALLVLCDDADTVIRDGALAVSGDRIAAVGRTEDVEARCWSSDIINGSSCLVMPGLINAHTHTPMTLFRGLADDLPLVDWLGRMREASQRVIRRDTVRLAASLAFAEMISSGTTTAVDMYFFPEALAEAAVAAGFRLVTGPVFVSRPGPDQVAVADQLAHGREFMQAYRDHELVQPCVMPHSPYDCSPEILAAARQLADEHAALLSTHAAETRGEVTRVMEQHGATPVQLLDRLGMLSPRTVLAHCVHVTPAEIALLAERQATVAHCPLSNLKLGDGIAPVAEWQRAGVRVTLGTDGPASSNDLNLWGIMRLAAVLQRGRHEDPSLTPARSIVRAATCDAARSLGQGGRLGSLEEGKLADFILIDLKRAHAVPLYEPYSHLVYALGRDDVVTVVINGRIVLRDRQLTTLDEDQLIADVHQVTREIGSY